jgi:hypothetical protein
MFGVFEWRFVLRLFLMFCKWQIISQLKLALIISFNVFVDVKS